MRNTRPLVRLLLLCLVLCAGAARAENSKTLLWEARAGTKTVYLFGTIHLGHADLYPLAKPTEDAWGDARKVALEAEIWNQEAVLAATQIGMLPPGRSLDREVPADQYAQLQQVLGAGGLPPAAIRQMKPFMAMLMLVQLEFMKLGYVPDAGLDMHFMNRAMTDGKPLIALETVESQFRMMDGLSPPLQQAMLKMTLDDIAAGRMLPMAEQLLSGWRKGDAPSVLALLRAEELRLPAPLAAEFRDKFLTARNRVMLAGIDKALTGTDRLFVAVGALHLIGPGSVVDLLEQKGFAVKRR